ncbi:MAG: SulP family inorganic anion transporter [Rhizomicrobium sp.]|jgi:SulP family sulfate permease
MDVANPAASPPWRLFIPKVVTTFREGYSLDSARADLFAGLTVAIVALPLSLALAIASGVDPGRGLFTAVVAGFLVSALGGSRFQIAGPTGAFVVVVAGVVQKFGYEGLVGATMMAGILLILTGLARLGTYIKYIPYPVVTGFTSGIAVVIFSSQLGDLLGLSARHVPADFVGKLQAYAGAADTFNPVAFGIAAGTLTLILLLQRFAARVPSFLVAIVAAGLAVWFFKLHVPTIGTKFGGIPSSLPSPHVPTFNFEELRALFPAAFTIFVLGGIESLLSATVADGMTGRRHRANCELVAQGIANVAAAALGGIPATGAIARTATNIRAGGRTPVAGMVHAAAILTMMAAFAPLGSYIPLASLAAILTIVCWNMAEAKVFSLILRSASGDRTVLLATFLLTVFFDLSIGIATGVVLASLMFAHKMAQVTEARAYVGSVPPDVDEIASPNSDALARTELPPGVEVFRLSGPFFFAAAMEFEDVLSRTGSNPKVLILRMAGVPVIDSTGAAALKRLEKGAASKGTTIILSELGLEPQQVLAGLHVKFQVAATFPESLGLAREVVGQNLRPPSPSGSLAIGSG